MGALSDNTMGNVKINTEITINDSIEDIFTKSYCDVSIIPPNNPHEYLNVEKDNIYLENNKIEVGIDRQEQIKEKLESVVKEMKSGEYNLPEKLVIGIFKNVLGPDNSFTKYLESMQGKNIIEEKIIERFEAKYGEDSPQVEYLRNMQGKSIIEETIVSKISDFLGEDHSVSQYLNEMKGENMIQDLIYKGASSILGEDSSLTQKMEDFIINEKLESMFPHDSDIREEYFDAIKEGYFTIDEVGKDFTIEDDNSLGDELKDHFDERNFIEKAIIRGLDNLIDSL